MTDKEVMQEALDALLHMCYTTKATKDYNAEQIEKALANLRQKLNNENQTNPNS